MHTEAPEVSPGKWINLRAGDMGGTTYLTTGAALNLVNQMFIKTPNLESCALNSMPLWAMKTKADQARQVECFKKVITVEDHLLDGGFGSWLLEATLVRPDLLARITLKALDSKICGMVAQQSTLNALGGLTEKLLCE